MLIVASYDQYHIIQGGRGPVNSGTRISYCNQTQTRFVVSDAKLIKAINLGKVNPGLPFCYDCLDGYLTEKLLRALERE